MELHATRILLAGGGGGVGGGIAASFSQQPPPFAFLLRLSPSIYTLFRRALGLFYITASPLHLSSGQGSGCWPVGGGEGEKEEEEDFAPAEGGVVELPEEEEEGGGGGTLWSSGAAAAAATTAAAAKAQEGGDSDDDDDIIILSGSTDARPPPPPPTTRVPLAPFFPSPSSSSSRIGTGSASTNMFSAPSGSKYADSAPSREGGALISAAAAADGVGGSGAPSPALLNLFLRCDFAPLQPPPPPPLPIFQSKQQLEVWEAAQLFRSQADSVAVFGYLPVFGAGATAATGGGAAAGPSPPPTATGSSAAASSSAPAPTPGATKNSPTASSGASPHATTSKIPVLELPCCLATACDSTAASPVAPFTQVGSFLLSSQAPAASPQQPPFLAGVCLLLFAPQLLGLPPPLSSSQSPTTIISAATASLISANSIPLSAFPIAGTTGSPLPLSAVGARPLAIVLRAYGWAALHMLKMAFGGGGGDKEGGSSGGGGGGGGERGFPHPRTQRYPCCCFFHFLHSLHFPCICCSMPCLSLPCLRVRGRKGGGRGAGEPPLAAPAVSWRYFFLASLGSSGSFRERESIRPRHPFFNAAVGSPIYAA